MCDCKEKPPVIDPNAPLAQYWEKKVCELATIVLPAIEPGQRARHQIYSLLLCKVLGTFFNGNKNGQDGKYPWRAQQMRNNGTYRGDRYGDRYLGHNIACLAVDGKGELIDFDFNHNDLFSSSVEHAESRLVRRIFSLSQLYDGWQVGDEQERSSGYMSTLSDVTIYTSLESCAQCAGIMNLATVKEVVYLQRDPGQFAIGNILRNLTTPGLRAALPVPGSAFGLSYYDELNSKYLDFYNTVSPDKPFWISPDGKKVDKSQSITSFLCTDDAMDIFNRAGADFDAFHFEDPVVARWRPAGVKGALSNEEVLANAKRFYAYVNAQGRRGTPHKL